MALHKGIQEPIRLNIADLFIKCDNLLVIYLVKGVWRIPWKLHIIVNDLKILLQQSKSVHIQHIFREANTTAEW